VGVTVFLTLLLFAVQLALNLYATSTVTSVAFDAARQVAGAAPAASQATAEAHARALLGGFEAEGGTLQFDWADSTNDVVVLHVVARRPSLLPNVHFPFDAVDRTVRVRRERLQ
jgi:hypothetical protein